MATISLSLTGIIDGIDQTITKSATIDDSVIPYFFQHFQQKYGNDSGQLQTNADAFNAFAKDFAGRTAAEVKAYVTDLVMSKIQLPNIEVTPNG